MDNKKKVLLAAALTAAGAYALYRYASGNKKEAPDGQPELGGIDMETLLNEQFVTEYLAGSDVADWFRQNNCDGGRMYLMRLSREILGTSCAELSDEDLSAYLLQCVFVGEEISAARVINFGRLSPELEKRLDDGNGIIQVSEEREYED